MLNFCANLSTLFKEFEFMERFSKAKSFGFKYYEFQNPYEFDPIEISKEAVGMQCVLINSYIDGSDSFGYASIPGQEYTFCESLNKINPYYFNLGVQKVHVLAGLKQSGVSVDDQLKCYVNGLQSINDFLDTFGMTAVIEPLCEDVKPNYFLNSFDLAVEALKTLNLPNVKLLLDIYHLHKITGDVKANLEKYYPYAGHIQVSQAPGRNEPYCEGGEIDYDYVFDFLRIKKHTDPIGLEYFPSEGKSTEESLEWMQRFV